MDGGIGVSDWSRVAEHNRGGLRFEAPSDWAATGVGKSTKWRFGNSTVSFRKSILLRPYLKWFTYTWAARERGEPRHLDIWRGEKAMTWLRKTTGWEPWEKWEEKIIAETIIDKTMRRSPVKKPQRPNTDNIGMPFWPRHIIQIQMSKAPGSR